MVDYIYSDYFYEHESSHIVIVNSDATVTGVAMSAPTITGARYVITEVDIQQEKFDLEESLCSEDNLIFGLLEASRLWFTMYHYDDGEDVPDLTDEEVAVYIYFNGNSSNIFRVGTFIVKEDKYGADRSKREVNSYDVLNDLRDFDISKWYSAVFKNNPLPTVGELRDSLFTWLTTPKTTQYLGIPGGNYGYTLIQEDVDLVNDDLEVEQGIESDTITFGFFMQGLLEVNGVFAHVDRQGIIRYKQLESYDAPAVKVFGENLRIPPLNYPDYHVWGIGYVRAIDKNNMEIAKMGSSAYEHPSIYNIVDNFVFSNTSNRNGFDDAVKAALQNARDVMTHLWYYPFDTKCIGNLTYEVGDRIDIERAIYNDDGGISGYETFYTYILERHFSGVNGFKDTMSAKGDRKQPKYKINKNSNWHKGDSDNNSVDTSDGTGEVVDDSATKFIKYCRNIGIRLLLEPSQVSVKYVKELGNHHVELKWKDPSDITNYKPLPCEWAGTIVVRSDSHVPVHPWDDCEILVDSTTRDEYLEDAFIDNTIENNKKYYYGIFPYSIIDDSDPEHIIKRYRFTKVVSVNTQGNLLASLITSAVADGTSVTLTFTIPELEDSTYSEITLVGKKNGIPRSKTDGNKFVTLSSSDTSVTVTGLDELTTYYFVIFSEDNFGNKADSDPSNPVSTGEKPKKWKETISYLKMITG